MRQDEDLRHRFDALREREREELLPFARFAGAAAGVHPLRGLILPLAAAAVAVGLWIGLSRPQIQSRVETSVIWRGPTDVLLEGWPSAPLRELPRLDASVIDDLIYQNRKRDQQPGDTP